MGSARSVEELAPGDHACLTFSDEQERLDIVAAFVQEGLSRDQRVLCYTDTYLPPALTAILDERGVAAADAVQRGRLEVLPASQAWLAEGGFRPDRALRGVAGRIRAAGADDPTGVRITADMGWAIQPVTGVEHLVEFESMLGDLCAEAGVTGMCQYDRHRFDPVTLAGATAVHLCSVAATVYHEDPILRVCRQHRPPGIRLAGEIDYSACDALAAALAESLRLDRHVHVNLAELRLIDATAGGVLIKTAATLAEGQRMTVVCRRTVGQVLRHLGAEQLPNLHLAVTTGES